MSGRQGQGGERGGDERLAPGEALVLVAAAFLLLATAGGVLRGYFGVGGLVLAEVGAVLVPTLLSLRRAGLAARSALSSASKHAR